MRGRLLRAPPFRRVWAAAALLGLAAAAALSLALVAGAPGAGRPGGAPPTPTSEPPRRDAAAPFAMPDVTPSGAVVDRSAVARAVRSLGVEPAPRPSPELLASLPSEGRPAQSAEPRPGSGNLRVRAYLQGIHRVLSQFESGVAFVSSINAAYAAAAVSAERRQAVLGTLADLAREAEQNLRALDVPPAAQEYHQRLTRTLRSYGQAAAAYWTQSVRPDGDTIDASTRRRRNYAVLDAAERYRALTAWPDASEPVDLP